MVIKRKTILNGLNYGYQIFLFEGFNGYIVKVFSNRNKCIYSVEAGTNTNAAIGVYKVVCSLYEE